MARTLLLFSGGLDSTFMLWHLITKEKTAVFPLYMHNKDSKHADYDAKVCANSLQMVMHLTGKDISLDKESYTAAVKPNGFVVGRHMMFAGAAIPYLLKYKCRDLALAVYPTARDAFADAKDEFLVRLEQTFTASAMNVRVRALDAYANKVDILKIMDKEGILPNVMYTARWCYNRSEDRYGPPTRPLTGCGTCKSCKAMLSAWRKFYA